MQMPGFQTPEYCTNFDKLRDILNQSSQTFIKNHETRLGRKFSWNFLSLDSIKSNIIYIFDSIFNNPRSQANVADYNRARNVVRCTEELNGKDNNTLIATKNAIVAIAYTILQSNSRNFKAALLPDMITLEQDKSGQTGGFYPDAAFGNKAFHRNDQKAYVFAQVLNSYNQRLSACNMMLESDIEKLKLKPNVKALDEALTQEPTKIDAHTIINTAQA